MYRNGFVFLVFYTHVVEYSLSTFYWRGGLKRNRFIEIGTYMGFCLVYLLCRFSLLELYSFLFVSKQGAGVIGSATDTKEQEIV